MPGQLISLPRPARVQRAGGVVQQQRAGRRERGHRAQPAEAEDPREAPIRRHVAVHASGRVYRLTCFVGDDDALEEELRPTLEQVLSLWLDRLSVTSPD